MLFLVIIRKVKINKYNAKYDLQIINSEYYRLVIMGGRVYHITVTVL